MFSKAKLNFVVDAMILVAFLAAAVSGIVLLTQPHGGFKVAVTPTSNRRCSSRVATAGTMSTSGGVWP